MDINKQMDTSIFEEKLVKKGAITYSQCSYKKLSLSDLTSCLERHNIFKYPFESPESGIIFDATCEYTGIHSHSIVISVLDGKTEHMSIHHLNYPEFNSFLISKINYFEKNYPHLPIYIHESILLGAEGFHKNRLCDNWVSEFWVNNMFQGGGSIQKNKDVVGFICNKRGFYCNGYTFPFPIGKIKPNQLGIITSIKELYRWKIRSNEIENFIIQKVKCKNATLSHPGLWQLSKVVSYDIIAEKPESLKNFIYNLPCEDILYLLESDEYPWIISFLDINQLDINVIGKMLKNNSLEYFPTLTKQREWCLLACKYNGYNYKYISEEFKNDDEIIKMAISRSDGYIYKKLPEHLKEKYENICLNLNPSIMNYIRNPTIEQWKIALDNKFQLNWMEYFERRNLQKEVLKMLAERIHELNFNRSGWIYYQIIEEFARS